MKDFDLEGLSREMPYNMRYISYGHRVTGAISFEKSL